MTYFILCCGGLIGATGILQIKHGWVSLGLALRKGRAGWLVVAETCLAVGILRILTAGTIIWHSSGGFGGVAELLIPLLGAVSLFEIRKLRRIEALGRDHLPRT